MKALSILQTWASLVVLGHKKIETRSFQRSYRGALLIHASKGYNWQQESLAFEFSQQLKDSRVYHNKRGAIIGMAQMEGCEPVELIKSMAERKGEWWLFGKLLDWQKEMRFGDYSADRYGWLLSNPIAFPKPIPCKGSLGLWVPPADVLKQVEEQLKAS